MDRTNFSTDENMETMRSQDADAALAEIERILDRMLVLAKVSASSLDVDRDALQKTFARLQSKIDRIADSLEGP